MNVLIGKSLPWQDGYFAQAEGYARFINDAIVLDCPYDVVTQWASHHEWHAGYQFRIEESPSYGEGE
jgi:hypothetical protein